MQIKNVKSVMSVIFNNVTMSVKIRIKKHISKEKKINNKYNKDYE